MTSVTGGHNMILRFLFRHYKRILWTGQVCGILFCVRKIEISGERFQYVPKSPPRLFTVYYADCRKTSIVVKKGVEGRSPQQGLGAVAPAI